MFDLEKIKSRIVIGILLFFVLMSGNSQAQFDKLLFKRLTVEEGLSQNTVSCIYHDRYGYIWVGTDNGLNRYDGYDIKIYQRIEGDNKSLSNNWITGIIEDKDGDVWVLTGSGLNRYDRKTDSFKRYEYNREDPTSPPGIMFGYTFFDGNNNLWFTTGNGVCRYNKSTDDFTRLLFDSLKVSEVSSWYSFTTRDKDGFIWVGGINKCIRIDPVGFGVRSYEFNYHGEMNPYSIFCDSDNGIWITSTRNRVLKFNRKLDRFEEQNFPTNKTVGYENGGAIAESADKKLWYGASFGLLCFDKKKNSVTVLASEDAPKSVNALLLRGDTLLVASNYGLYYIDTKTKAVRRYEKFENNDYSLSDNQIISFYVDRNNSIWLRTNRAGVNKIIDPVFKPFFGDKTPLSSKTIYDIHVDREGFIWFSTLHDGINKYNPRTGDNKIFKPSKSDPYSIQSGFLNMVYQDKYGKYWIGSRDKGISNYDPGTDRFIPHKSATHSLKLHPTRSYFEDSDGVLWIGTRGGGLNRYDRATDTFKEYVFKSENSLLNQIITIYEDSDRNLLLGTDSGLVSFNRDDGSYAIHWSEKRNTTFLGSNSIFDIHEDSEGNLWLTTYGAGLVKFNKKDRSYRFFTTEDGLIGNYVYNIITDDEGYFWLSTNRGLSRFDPKNQKFLNFSKAEGLPSNEIKPGTTGKMMNGFLLFGTANGAFYFDPKRVNQKLSSHVGITGFTSHNHEGTTLSDLHMEPENHIAYDSYLLTFRYSAFEYDAPHTIKYAYMLEGFDSDWKFVGGTREAEYMNLPPGDYTFKVSVANQENRLLGNVSSVSFTIDPPFWGLWYVKIAAILLSLSLLAYLINYRIKRVKLIAEQKATERIAAIERENRIKEGLSRDLHDDINSDLVAIINNCSMLAEESVIVSEIRDRVAIISELSEQLRGVINDIVWFVKPGNETNDQFIDKMYDVPFKLLCAIDYEISIDEDFIGKTNFTMEQKKHIYLIFKEALQNIVKHSGATFVDIRLVENDNRFQLFIKDNGKGFDQEKLRYGNGFFNMKKRAEALHGLLHFESQLGIGTTLELTVEYKSEDLTEP